MNLNQPLRLAIITFTTLILIFFSGLFYSILYKKYYREQYAQVNETISGKTNYDIIFIGSSRTHVHINPKIIDSVTNLNSYNFGIEGGRILEIEMILKAYLQSHLPPSMVVVDIMKVSLDVEGRSFFNPNRYYPFLKNEIIFNTINNYKNATLLKYLDAYRITEADDYIKGGVLMSILGKTEKKTGPVYKGYMANIPDTIPPCIKTIINDTTDIIIQLKAKESLNNIIKMCKEKGSKIMFTYSPEYSCVQYTKDSIFFNYIDSISAANNIKFYNYQKSAFSSQNKLFCNENHLNRFGADIFSREIGLQIKNALLKNIN